MNLTASQVSVATSSVEKGRGLGRRRVSTGVPVTSSVKPRQDFGNDMCKAIIGWMRTVIAYNIGISRLMQLARLAT